MFAKAKYKWEPKIPTPKDRQNNGFRIKAKKVLDKIEDKVYNIRKDEAVLMPSFYDNPGLDDAAILERKDLRITLNHLMDTLVELNTLTEDTPCGIIAGGAIRDYVMGWAVKDYDVFFNCRDQDHAYEVLDQLSLRLPELTKKELGSRVTLAQKEKNLQGETYDRDVEVTEKELRGVVGLINYEVKEVATLGRMPLILRDEKQRLRPIQLIVGVWPNGIAESFDLSTSMATLNPLSGELKLHEEFVRTMKTGKITTKDAEPDDYTKRRLQRVSDRMSRRPLVHFWLEEKEGVYWAPIPGDRR